MERISDDKLLELLNDIESDMAERKESFRGDVPDKARQAVCAFANDLPNHNAPGVLFIGADDSGKPTGEPITDELLRMLSDMKTDGNILPMPALTVEKRALKGSDMAVVTVIPSDMPPVKYKGRVWIRTGPRRALANEQEERILVEKRRFKNLPYDLYPISFSAIHDLSRSLFENDYLPLAIAPDVLEANNRTYEEQLSSSKMVVSPHEATPTVLGLLSIGKSPQDFIPGAYIQFLRIDGLQLTDPLVDADEIGGSIVDMLRRTEEKIRAHNRVAVDVTSSATHEISTPYPLAAIQQIIYNAILHRSYEHTNAPVRIYWYSDRIEVISPGGPYGNVTPENFGEPGITDYRNPNLAAVMKTFGFVQTFGRGIAIAKNEMNRNGNPPMEFDVNQNVVSCIIRRK
ncbi:MAG: putative DNA binding domain-containing protein [Clostridiales bacterium]|nr:putative DNA binding domain-containing protein [Clostridiales bacterium]